MTSPTIIRERFRKRPPHRRRGFTEVLTYRKDEEGQIKFSATFNWEEGGWIIEVFCLAFKEGTDMRSALHHACIAVSVALQRGATMADLAHSLGEDDRERKPGSILGLIVRAGVVIDEQRGFPPPLAPADEIPKPATEAAAADAGEPGEPIESEPGAFPDGGAEAWANHQAPDPVEQTSVSGVTGGESAAPAKMEIPAFLIRKAEAP